MIDRSLAQRIENTILRPDALPADVHRAATHAMQQGFAAVVVAPVFVKRVVTMLAGAVRCGTVIAFPYGTSKSTLKAIEATSSIKDGADQIDVVPHLPNLLRRDVDAAKVELLEIVRAARSTRRDVVIGVIVETVLLINDDATESEARLADACRAVRESGCDAVVTSSGCHPRSGATPQAVALLKKHVGELVVKATGGIGDPDAAQRMIDAGADRVSMEDLME
jgi:deoxyribose-phosphate aldolase